MNRLIQKVVESISLEESNELTFKDGIKLINAEKELAVIEDEFNKYYKTLNLIKPNLSSSAIEAISFTLDTDSRNIELLSSLESGDVFKKATTAVLNLVKSVDKWFKSKAKTIFIPLSKKINYNINFIKENINCMVSESDIKEIYSNDKEKLNTILRQYNRGKRDSNILALSILKAKDGFDLYRVDDESVTFYNILKDKKEVLLNKDIPDIKLTYSMLENDIFNKTMIDNVLKKAYESLKQAEKRAKEANNKDDLDRAKRDVSIAKSLINVMKIISKLLNNMYISYNYCVNIKRFI